MNNALNVLGHIKVKNQNVGEQVKFKAVFSIQIHGPLGSLEVRAGCLAVQATRSLTIFCWTINMLGAHVIEKLVA